MKVWKKWTALLLVLLLAAGLSACAIPMPGFADYDVSGYIQALLDSSYHAQHDAFMSVANVTEESAQGNNTSTVENAAISFCNTYGVNPSDAQLQELQKVMRQAFALTKYTVTDETKVDSGYYLEVEVTPISNFAGRDAEIKKLKEEAVQEATYRNNAASAVSKPSEEKDRTDEEEDEDDYDEYDEDEDYGDEDEDGGEEEEVSSAPEKPEPQPAATMVDANALFVDKVLEFCKGELANIQYDDQPHALPLDILLTDKGELQLDLNQIDAIDKAAVRLS